MYVNDNLTFCFTGVVAQFGVSVTLLLKGTGANENNATVQFVWRNVIRDTPCYWRIGELMTSAGGSIMAADVDLCIVTNQTCMINNITDWACSGCNNDITDQFVSDNIRYVDNVTFKTLVQCVNNCGIITELQSVNNQSIISSFTVSETELTSSEIYYSSVMSSIASIETEKTSSVELLVNSIKISSTEISLTSSSNMFSKLMQYSMC